MVCVASSKILAKPLVAFNVSRGELTALVSIHSYEGRMCTGLLVGAVISAHKIVASFVAAGAFAPLIKSFPVVFGVLEFCAVIGGSVGVVGAV